VRIVHIKPVPTPQVTVTDDIAIRDSQLSRGSDC